MSPSPLSDCLLRDGMLGPDVLHTAVARQTVYGGGLDTALLELQALDEVTLWTALANATGVPVPADELLENPDPDAAAVFDVQWSRRCRAVPVGEHDGVLQLLCAEPIDERTLGEACTALGVSVEIYVVPEVRLAAARQVVYGDPVPPRLLRLLARLLGAQAVRRWVEEYNPRPGPARPEATPEPAADATTTEAAMADATTEGATTEAATTEGATTEAATAEAADGHAAKPAPATGGDGQVMAVAAEVEISAPSFPRSSPTPVGRAPTAGKDGSGASGPAPMPEARAELTEDQLCRAAIDPHAETRLPALQALRARLAHPRVRALTEKMRRDLAGPADAGVLAASALGELRDPDAVPALMAALQASPPVVEAAHRALVAITKQDFGHSRRRWNAWWERHRGDGRMEWLFEGLAHKAPEIRFASSEELRVVTGEYFGYHFDLPKREREEARERWRAWWRSKG